LRRYGIHSVDEAINFLGYGMVAEKRFQTAEVGARGVHLTSDFGSHVLLMVDGHVLNEQWGATAYFDRGTGIPFEIIDHIELVLGPGSVLYGSNAMLGIVHIVTKRAKDYAGAHVVFESEVPTSLRIAGGVGKEFELGGTAGEVVFELEDYVQNGPTFDFGPQDAGPDAVTGEVRDFDPIAADRIYPAGIWGGRGDDAYHSHAPAAYLKLELGDLQIAARAAMYDRTYPSNSGNFDDPDSHEVDHWGSIDVKHTAVLSAAVGLTTRLYGDLYQYDQYWTSNGAEDCLEGQDAGCLWHLRGVAQWIGLEPQLTFDWFEDERATTLIGLDGRIKHIDSSIDFIDNLSGESPGAIGAYDRTEKALAAYLQQTFWFTEWLGANAGARFDVDDRFGNHFSPRAAIVTLPWRGGTLKGIYSEAFRAPTAFDIYYNDPSTQIPGGADLAPETVRSVEASLEQRFGAQSVTLSAYKSWWNDLLLLQELTPEEVEAAIARGELEPSVEYGYQVKNVSRIESYGFDLGYQGSLVGGRLRYGLGVSEAFARREEPGSDPAVLNVAPQTFGNVRVSYDFSRTLPTLALAARFVGERPVDDYPDAGFAEPYVELRGTISGATPIPGLSYRAGVNYVSAERGAYVVRGGTLPNGERELAPNDQLRANVGLSYDLAL
jgi:outer membrane receptor protein involved in Fe transport